MSNISNNPLLFSIPLDDTLAEYLAKVLLGYREFALENEESVLTCMELLRGFAITKGLDSKNMTNALEQHYLKLIPIAIEHVFSRLELVGSEARISIYIRENEANLFLWNCKEEDGSNVDFCEIYLPYDLIADLGENYHPWYSGSTTYGKSIEPMRVLELYHNHKCEIIDVNVSKHLEELQQIFNYFITCVKKGLNNTEIVEAFDAMDFDPSDNEVDSVTLTPCPI